MNIGSRVHEALSDDLFLGEVVGPLEEFGANLGVVLEVGVLAGQLVLVAGDLAEEVVLRVEDVGEGLLGAPGADHREQVAHRDRLLQLLPVPAGLVVGHGVLRGRRALLVGGREGGRAQASRPVLVDYLERGVGELGELGGAAGLDGEIVVHG